MSSILWNLQRRQAAQSKSWYARVVNQPAEEPLDLATVKSQLRVDFTDDDTVIAGYISAARDLIETECDRALMAQTWELGLNEFPACTDRIMLPKGALQDVASFVYTDSAQQNHTMVLGTDYLVNAYAEPAEVVLPYSQNWPAAELSPSAPVRIQFNCGWDTAEDVPQKAKQAMLMLIGDWYVNREDVVIGRTSTVAAKLPNGFDRLLTNLRLRNYTPYSR